MKTFRSISFVASAALMGLLAATPATAAGIAGVTCGDLSCTWNTPWASNIPIRLTIGTDQNNVLRWVASQYNNPSIIESQPILTPSRIYEFFGSSGDDLMVEVPSNNGGATITHGTYTLRGGSKGPKLVRLYGNGGRDIIIGGDYTDIINDVKTGGGVQGIVILHPSLKDTKKTATVKIGGWAIVGLSLTESITSVSKIRLLGGTGGSLCNFNQNPIESMSGSKSRKFGLTSQENFLTDTSWGEACVAMYVAAINFAFGQQ